MSVRVCEAGRGSLRLCLGSALPAYSLSKSAKRWVSADLEVAPSEPPQPPHPKSTRPSLLSDSLVFLRRWAIEEGVGVTVWVFASLGPLPVTPDLHKTPRQDQNVV